MYNLANTITFIRLILSFGLIASILEGPAWLQAFDVFVIALIFSLDALDGYFARVLRQESLMGAFFDIAVDRMIEFMLWASFVNVGLVSIWILMVFIVRTVLVDTIRSTAPEKAPLKNIKSPLGQLIVSGKFTRSIYAALKGVNFGFLALIQPLPELLPHFWTLYSSYLLLTSSVLIYGTIALCLIRGMPVIWEFFSQEERNFG